MGSSSSSGGSHMKRRVFGFTILGLVLGIVVAPWAQNAIPSSSLSTEVIARVRPALVELLADHGCGLGAPIFIRIFKQPAELEVWVQADSCFRLVKTYPICYFSGGLGPKTTAGDLQAPEGFYFVTPDRLNPHSDYHLSFDLGYPNAYDRAHGRTGSALMVHGDCVSIGCYAMTDKAIEEIYALAEASFQGGQAFFRVHIFPFHMTGERLVEQQDSPWYSFWENLQEGYECFEKRCRPPNVRDWEGR